MIRWRTFAAVTAAVLATGVVIRRAGSPADRTPGHRLGRSWLHRNARLAKLGGRVGATYASTAARTAFADAERREALVRQRELATAQQVSAELGQMKGALMKLGQMASYLDDGLPEPLRMALAQLQSDAPPMSVDLAVATLETELDTSIEQAFVEFDPDPIAAASIGQVHRAIAVVDGEERAVAVKIQYPGVDAAISADLRNADVLGALLKQGFGGLDPTEMVDEIKLRLAEEVDYTREAQNQQLFADFYRDHPFIHVPAVVPALSTPRVLTTELSSGRRWSDIVIADQATRDHYGEVLFRFVFRSLYRLGAFNGDPHPGNYLFHADGPLLDEAGPMAGTVTFLDFGLVKRFTADELATFASMVKAAALDHDPAEFRRIVEHAGMLRAGAPVSTDAVGEYFSQFYEAVRYDRPTTWSREYSSSIVRHTFDRTSPISQYATVPRAFVFIQRINLGLYALLGDLRASGNYRKISEELWPFVDGPPSTPLGEAEAEWVARRVRANERG